MEQAILTAAKRTFGPNRELDARFNADLANGLGNLVSRSLAMAERYCAATVPSGRHVGDSEGALQAEAERAVDAAVKSGA